MGFRLDSGCQPFVSLVALRAAAVARQPDQKQLMRGQGLLWLILPGHSASLREARAGTQPDPEQKSWKNVTC